MKTNFHISRLTALLALLLFGCSQDNNPISSAPIQPILVGEPIPSNTVRITAKIITTNTRIENFYPTMIQINSILGYGPAFAQPLVIGEVISVKFMVAPPSTNGVIVSTDIVSQQEFLGKISFLVYQYRVQ